MSVAEPSEELYRLAWFVINIYGFLWFNAKYRWRATQAPIIAFEAMKLIHGLPKHEKLVLAPVFERGFSYWAHSEQLLLACLASDDSDVRARAVARILRLRHAPAASQKSKKIAVRVFENPIPVYTATHFSSMIDWSKEQILEPPFLRKHSDDDIKAFESAPLILDVPGNTQFLERFIKLITEKGTCAASPTIRDGLSKATLRNRRSQSKLETKADFSN